MLNATSMPVATEWKRLMDRMSPSQKPGRRFRESRRASSRPSADDNQIIQFNSGIDSNLIHFIKPISSISAQGYFYGQKGMGGGGRRWKGWEEVGGGGGGGLPVSAPTQNSCFDWFHIFTSHFIPALLPHPSLIHSVNL